MQAQTICSAARKQSAQKPRPAIPIADCCSAAVNGWDGGSRSRATHHPACSSCRQKDKQEQDFGEVWGKGQATPRAAKAANTNSPKAANPSKPKQSAQQQYTAGWRVARAGAAIPITDCCSAVVNDWEGGAAPRAAKAANPNIVVCVCVRVCACVYACMHACRHVCI